VPHVVVLSHRATAHELGHLEPWLDDNGIAITHLYREDQPTLPDADLLIVLGSPSSVATGYCEPAAQSEIDEVAGWVAADRPYFGICFGAQVLARALGGSVAGLPETFRGYVRVESSDALPAVGPWIVWHNDAITAPPQAEVLGRLSHADLIFRAGRAWGVQPHIEVTPDSLDRMGIALGAAPAVRGPLVEALRADEAGAAERTRALLDLFLATALG
jgi:GMP synthase-like glutamine amidotransferase